MLVGGTALFSKALYATCGLEFHRGECKGDCSKPTIDVLVSIGWVSSASASTPGLGFGTVLAFGALIGMPIIFAACGFIVGLIEAFLYNVFARWSGGIEIDFEQSG
jgi:hypothetical protein